MSNVRNNLVEPLKKWKSLVGPTASKPGPILKSVDCTHEKAVKKLTSGSLADTSNIANICIEPMSKMKTITLCMARSLKVRPPIRIGTVICGLNAWIILLLTARRAMTTRTTFTLPAVEPEHPPVPPHESGLGAQKAIC